VTAIADAVAAYLAARDWPSEVGDDGTAVLAGGGEAGEWPVVFTPLEDAQQLLVHSVIQEAVPRDRLDATARYLTRANFGLVLGNFELDLDDGEVRYKTSIDVEDDAISDALIDHLVAASITVTDRYLPGLRAVIGGADPDATAAAIG
jgi:hypothetical protein